MRSALPALPGTRMAREPSDVLRDPTRLSVLHDAELIDAPPEEAFDRLTRLATRALGTTLAALSVVDGERQFFKSLAGPGAQDASSRETPLSHSICRDAVISGEPLRICDLASDPRHRDNPAAAALHAESYLGVPLVTRDGHALGTLCVLDARTREWTDDDLEVLRDLAAVAVAEVERRRATVEMRRTEETLVAAENVFRALVEQSLAGIFVVQDDRFTYVNPRLAEIFGLTREELTDGVRPTDLVQPSDRGAFAANVLPLLRGEEGSFRHTFRGRRADGETVHAEVHGTPAEVAGRPAVVGLLLDVTERVRAEHEREAALRARDRFYAMLSHELRTPISAIMLYNDLLVTEVYGALTEAQTEALTRSQRSARHLLELINDLLDLAKLEAGKMELRVEGLDLAEVVENVFLAVAPLASENGCELRLHVDRRPVPALSDARRIRQVLLNLLSNAVKFGEGRPVDVRVSSGGTLAVEVQDRGPGIRPADAARVFEDFVQLGGEASEEGTGLGLSIARRLAEALGGRLELESVPGEGSTFRFVLPHEP